MCILPLPRTRGRGNRSHRRANRSMYESAISSRLPVPLDVQFVPHVRQRIVIVPVIPVVRQARLVRVAVDGELLRGGGGARPGAAFGEDAGSDEGVALDRDVGQGVLGATRPVLEGKVGAGDGV